MPKAPATPTRTAGLAPAVLLRAKVHLAQKGGEKFVTIRCDEVLRICDQIEQLDSRRTA